MQWGGSRSSAFTAAILLRSLYASSAVSRRRLLDSRSCRLSIPACVCPSPIPRGGSIPQIQRPLPAAHFLRCTAPNSLACALKKDASLSPRLLASSGSSLLFCTRAFLFPVPSFSGSVLVVCMPPAELFSYRMPTARAMGAQLPPMPHHRLNVVVTGGSSGIGAAIVRVFAEAGHRVLFTYLTRLKPAEQLSKSYPNVTHHQLDQGDIRSVAAFARIVHEWACDRGVDVLVNNAALGSATVRPYVQRAAVSSSSSSSATPPDPSLCNHPGLPDSALRMLTRAAHDEALMRVNALGPLWVTDAVSDAVRTAADRARSVVIFIGSVGGGSTAIFPEYCPADLMSKAATTYLSKHLAADHVRDNVDVLCVSPGATETDMFRQSTLSKVADVASFVDSMPKRRLLQPDDVARTVFWLATQSPPGIFHGAVLDASMGLAVRPGLQTETNGNR